MITCKHILLITQPPSFPKESFPICWRIIVILTILILNSVAPIVSIIPDHSICHLPPPLIIPIDHFLGLFGFPSLPSLPLSLLFGFSSLSFPLCPDLYRFTIGFNFAECLSSAGGLFLVVIEERLR